MAFTPRDRPAWVRAVDAAGRALGGALARAVPLGAEALLARARRRTGLVDFGDDAFREPLGLLACGLEAEADLTPVGRLLARHEVTGLLEGRLRLHDWRMRHPEIAREPVRAPIFVTGSGRSGTSLLHELLAQDPGVRAPRTWEVLHPCPPPETASYESDPRRRRADREVALWESIAPAYRTMHEGGGDVPQECVYLTAFELRSDLLSGLYQVPTYARWLARCDMRPAYATHRAALQLLQWRCPGERWVLKAPSHLWTLDALLAVYPDARIVWTHRDPLRVAASMASLAATLYWMRSDRIDFPRIARQTVRSVAFMLEKATAQRDAGLLPASQVLDVRYADLVADPLATVAALYRHFGLELRPDARARMRAHLDTRLRTRAGEHRYAFADTGLDLAAERERFAPYLRRFDVPSEG